MENTLTNQASGSSNSLIENQTSADRVKRKKLDGDTDQSKAPTSSNKESKPEAVFIRIQGEDAWTPLQYIIPLEYLQAKICSLDELKQFIRTPRNERKKHDDYLPDRIAHNSAKEHNAADVEEVPIDQYDFKFIGIIYD